MISSDLKRCPHCNIEKNRLTDFYQVTKRRHEVVVKRAHWLCKPCAKEDVKEWNRTASQAKNILKDRHPEEYRDILSQVRIGRRELGMPTQKEIAEWLSK